MKFVGLVTVSMMVPRTHNVCPTSASVIDKASRQLESVAGVAVSVTGVEVAELMTFGIAVFVGRMVGSFVGVLLGFTGVFVADTAVFMISCVYVGSCCFKAISFVSKMDRPGPTNKYNINAIMIIPMNYSNKHF